MRSRPETLARLAGRQSAAPLNVVAARAAIAALEDGPYVQTSRMRNADERQEFFNQANARMLRWLDSQTNFVMLSVIGSPDPVIAHFAANRSPCPARLPRWTSTSGSRSAHRLKCGNSGACGI
jgi:histidinol-phosphate/aromatic aminotransferase/cobyric acid decarboxylase-like protein